MVAASVATGASEVEIGACQKLSCDIYQGLTNEGNVSKVLTVMFKVESINLGFEYKACVLVCGIDPIPLSYQSMMQARSQQPNTQTCNSKPKAGITKRDTSNQTIYLILNTIALIFSYMALPSSSNTTNPS